METSFFISIAALQQRAPGTPLCEKAVLAVLDSNLALICEVVASISGHGPLGSPT